MIFKIGDHVRISTEYPFHRELQGITGKIIALPDNKHKDEYIVHPDGEITRSLFLEGKVIWVSAIWLEFAHQMPPRP